MHYGNGARAGRYPKFHITIIMTVNIPIIDIIAISAISVLQALKNLDVIEQIPYDIHGIDDNVVLPILRY